MSLSLPSNSLYQSSSHENRIFSDDNDQKIEHDLPMLSFTDLMIGMIFLLLIVISTLSFTYRSQIDEQSLGKEVNSEDLEKQVAENTELKEKLLLMQTERDKQYEENQALFQQFVQEKQSLLEKLNKTLNTRLVPQKLLGELEKQFKQTDIPVNIDHDKGIIHFSNSLLFATSSSSLTKNGKQLLNQLAKILIDILPCYSHIETSNDLVTRSLENNKSCDKDVHKQIEAIFIEGHTDNVPFETKAYDNWLLSMNRAKETYQHLLLAQPKLNHLYNKSSQHLFSLSAYGETRPIATNKTRIGRAKNRRIDIRLISFGYTINF